MEARANVLRQMKICRFCLCETGQLTNIYEKQSKDIKQVPLPLQLMACIAIEVFPNDGMPQMICKTCRNQTLQAYNFKTNCKKADDALKVFLATGNLTKPELAPVGNNEPVSPSPVGPAPAPAPSPAPQKSTPSTLGKNIEPTGEPPKKRRKADNTSQENTEMITLNFSNNFNQSQQEQDETMDDNDITADSQNDESSVKTDDNSSGEEDPLGESLQDEETTTIAKVKTDCFPCPDCERSFPLKQLLDLHCKNHERKRNYRCDECDKSFFTKYDLNKHMQTHSDDRPFSCVVCKKAFSRESLLHRHEKIHVDVPKYLCTDCDKTFLSGEDLDNHNEKQHKKYRPFSCKLCHKSFVFKQGLERHIATHTNVKPHKCNYCEASFNSAIKLTRHVTSHAGLRPYPCKICGRTFLLSHHLTRHLRSHYAAQASEAVTPIGQHKCDVCSMSFRRKDSLINHSAIHSMVNLKCVICNTEFDNVNKVKEHITTHLSGLPFPCEKCDYSFETQDQLEDHELKHAEMEYEEIIEKEVIEEERKKMATVGSSQDSMDEDEYSGEEDIAEFTITNDLSNPEVVRRSKRNSKAKNYAEFLKDELGSDIDEEEQEMIEGEKSRIRMLNDENIELRQRESHDDDNEELSIKPIVRTEGTKVYARKGVPKKPKVQPINIEQIKMSQTVPTTLLDVPSTKDIAKMPNKEIFNMKIGDKTVMVQKLVLTKEQMQAMAKEGKLEKKGNTYILKKNPNMSLPNINLDSVSNIDFNIPAEDSINLDE